MSGVPYTFATATTSIPLSQLDANFATNATLGNATVGLGNTTTIVGNLTLQNPTITGVSNNITFASGTNGIYFNNASSALLNDYEEGAWTPGISFGGGTTGITYALQTGKYTKIGRLVVCTGYFTLSSKGSSTGNAKITGLPFTIYNASGNYSSFSAFYYANMGLPALNYGVSAYGETNGTVADLFSYSNTASTTLNDSNFLNASQIGPLQFSYFTS